MKAMIMAGGEGTRLRPLTCDIPKPMVRLCGRPVIEYILDLLEQHGFDHVGITVRYLPDVMMNHFADNRYHQMSLEFTEEDLPLGTAGSVKNACKGTEDILVISGDALCDFDLSAAVRCHQENQSDATIVVKKVSDPREFGVVDVNPDGSVSMFIEKPSYSQTISDLANTGVYVLSASALALIPEDKAFDFSKDLFPLMLKQNMKLMTYEDKGYWCDIGDLESYRNCQRDILSGAVHCHTHGTIGEDGNLYKGEHLQEGGILQPPVYIGEGVIVEEGAIVAPYSVLDDGAIIKKGARVSASIVLRDSFVGEKATLTQAILCQNSAVKKKAMLFEGAVAGKSAIIGEKAMVAAGVKIWPHKEIENDARIYEHQKTGQSSPVIFDEAGIKGEIGTQLTPEVCAKIGACVGSVGHTNIVVGCCMGKSADMLKSAVLAGVQSTGMTAIDMGETFLGAFHFAMNFCDARLGIFITGGNEASIEIFAEGGLPLTRTMERTLEGILTRGEFHRSTAERTGERVALEDIHNIYKQNILQSYTKGLQGIQVQIKSTNPQVQDMAENLIQHLGGTIGGELTLQIGGRGEGVSIFDKDMGSIPHRRVLALCCLDSFMQGQGASLPFDAPRMLDSLAKEKGVKLHRYLSCPADDSDQEARAIAKDQLWSRDGILMAVKLLSCLKRNKITLKDLEKTLPDFNTAVKTVLITGNLGELMRRLNSQKENAITEGVLISDQRGTVLIRPTKRGTGVKIYAEALKYETAFELCDDMSAYIKNTDGTPLQ